MTDPFLGGAWVALMGFTPLPSALLVTMLAMDKIAAGGERLLARRLAVQALGARATSAARDRGQVLIFYFSSWTNRTDSPSCSNPSTATRA